ncbi:ubiquitin-activating enzyme-like protein [Perkinsela sp. CCAP 1560/4]|nr:ubiquitin-activating enzyme-like protein [Perkinsela sp. CCAP 1560/4]|eukprot:KNH07735.1 ubiquitin-activating enzyme-like protein [Perkinsela sp. CCAP 1560/4]
MAFEYHDEFMAVAFHEAKKALHNDEVPVGCVLVFGNKTVISCGHNETNEGCSALFHAELVAIQKLMNKLKNEADPTTCWMLKNGLESRKIEDVLQRSVLYVTVEPCIMCASALRMLTVGRVFYGCRNDRFGGNGTTLSVHDSTTFREKCKEGNPATRSFSFPPYESTCVEGTRLNQSIDLLKNFYKGENKRAPTEKRILKPAR